MHRERSPGLTGTPQQVTTGLETELLELFAPTVAESSSVVSRSLPEHTSLWQRDAIHRANNMAQLACSLAHVGENPSQSWLNPAVATQTRSLSRLYAELGVEYGRSVLVPCREILEQMVGRLTSIFGQSRSITSATFIEALDLPCDERRALALICSELVINALKYAFVGKEGGTISVSLRSGADAVELVVEDDGVGRIETYAAGQGGGLMDRLSALLHATVARTAGPGAHGFRVAVLMPVNASQTAT